MTAIQYLVDPNCKRCPLSTTRTLVVQPEYTDSTRIMFIGRDGGEKEDKAGTPLLASAPAGGLLRRLIAECHIPMYLCGFDNVVHCHTPKNRGPNAYEVAKCRVWVDRVRQAVKPKIVVLLGQEAAEAWYNPHAFMPKKAIKALRDVANQWFDESDGTRVLITYHPSSALHGGDSRRKLVQGLKMVARELGYVPDEPQYTRVTLGEFLESSYDMVSFDAEWDRQSNVLGLGLACRVDHKVIGCWIPKAKGGMGILDFLSQGCQYVGHNIESDLRALCIPPEESNQWVLDDTMVMAQVLGRSQTLGSVGLKELALHDLGLSWDTLTELGLPEDLPPDVLADYCIKDCVATLMLWEKYREELD